MKTLGCVNAYARSAAWRGSKVFEFDGTTLGLVKAALAVGAKEGERLLANYGGSTHVGARPYVLVSAPHDARASGFWIEEMR